MIKIEFTPEQGILIRNLIDLGLKAGGIAVARELIALDEKIVEAGKAQQKKDVP